MLKSKNGKAKKPDLSAEIRGLGVIVEDTNRKVDIIADQYLDISKDVKDIKKTVDSHTEMIGNLAVDVSIVKQDVEFIKSSMKRKIDVEEFAALERRVSLLEKKTTKTN